MVVQCAELQDQLHSIILICRWIPEMSVRISKSVSIAVPTTTKLELKMEQQQRLPTHITAADTAATPVSLMHTLMQPMHMIVQPCHLGIPQSATPCTECDAPTSGPATSGTLVAGLWTISRCCVFWLDLGGMVMQRCNSQLSASQPRLL